MKALPKDHRLVFTNGEAPWLFELLKQVSCPKASRDWGHPTANRDWEHPTYGPVWQDYLAYVRVVDSIFMHGKWTSKYDYGFASGGVGRVFQETTPGLDTEKPPTNRDPNQVGFLYGYALNLFDHQPQFSSLELANPWFRGIDSGLTCELPSGLLLVMFRKFGYTRIDPHLYLYEGTTTTDVTLYLSPKLVDDTSPIADQLDIARDAILTGDQETGEQLAKEVLPSLTLRLFLTLTDRERQLGV